MDRGLLGELLLLVVPVLEDLREVDALLRHERHGHAPVVVGGAEGDVPFSTETLHSFLSESGAKVEIRLLTLVMMASKRFIISGRRSGAR